MSAYGFNILESLDAEEQLGVGAEETQSQDTDLIVDLVEDANENQAIEAAGDEVDAASDELQQMEEDGVALERLYDFAKMALARPNNPGFTVVEGLMVDERLSSILGKYGRTPRPQTAVTENLMYNQVGETTAVVEGIGETIKGWGDAAWKWLKKIWDGVKEFFKGIFNAFAAGKKKADSLRKKFNETKGNKAYKTEKRTMALTEYILISTTRDKTEVVANLLNALSTLEKEWSFQEQYNVLEEIARTAETNKEGGLKEADVAKMQKEVNKLLRKNPTGKNDVYRYNGKKAVKVGGSATGSYLELGKNGTSDTSASSTSTLREIFSNLPFGKTIYEEVININLAKHESVEGQDNKFTSTTIVVPGRVLTLDSNQAETSANAGTIKKGTAVEIFTESELMERLTTIEKLCDASLAVQKKEKELDGMMSKLTNWFRKDENKRLNFAARSMGHNALSVSKPLLAISKRTVSALLQACAVSMSKGFSDKEDKDDGKKPDAKLDDAAAAS